MSLAHSPWRQALLAGLLVVSAVLLSLAASQVFGDSSPPEVYAVVPEEVPAGSDFEVFLSANRPVTFRLEYGDKALDKIGQDVTVQLPAEVGSVSLSVEATDAAGLSANYSFDVFGVPLPQPKIRLSASEAIPGEPISASIKWAPAELAIESLEVRLEGRELTVYRDEGEAIALGSVPLGTPAGSWEFEVTVVDGYGRRVSATRPLKVVDDAREVQELNVSPSVLAVSTPAARELEARVMEHAYAAGENTGAPLWNEPFKLPAQGRLTSPYGQPRRFARGGNISYHHGTDIAAPEGTPIYASNRGRVMVADFLPIKGGLVVIDHGAKVYSLYFHQSRIHVEVGDLVDRGEVIGEIGTTGLSTGPHLHWEMRVNTISTNPMSWVDRVLP